MRYSASNAKGLHGEYPQVTISDFWTFGGIVVLTLQHEREKLGTGRATEKAGFFHSPTVHSIHIVTMKGKNMPLNDLDRELMRATLPFLQKYAITPPDGLVDDLANRDDVTVDGQARKYNSAANPNFQIGYGHLHRVNNDWVGGSQNLKLQKPESIYIDVKYRHEINDSEADEYVKFYWLPWDQRGGIVKISLIVPPPRPGQKAWPDPDLFFTAALSGCSIFVRGSRKHPTVYHAGIGGTSPGGPGEHWRKLYKAIIPDEEGTEEEFSKRSEVNTLDYVQKTGRPQKDVTDYGKFLKKKQKEVKAKIVHSWGCVFGIRDENQNWSFYYQLNVCVTYQKMKKKFFRRVPDNTPPRTINYPMLLKKFYPGENHVELEPFKKIILT
jgi:hypothetical protein